MRRLIRELVETVLPAWTMSPIVQFGDWNVMVDGSSMRPTLTEGQRLLSDKLTYAGVARDPPASAPPFVDDDRSTNQLFVFRSPTDLTGNCVNAGRSRPSCRPPGNLRFVGSGDR